MVNRNQFASHNLWSGILFGLGMIAFIDEAIFHQLLHWHHFYDRATTEIGLISDGLFHVFSWFATIGSLFMLAGLRQKQGFWIQRWWGGVLLGGGAFQLYDGVVQHKWMRLHQIRYVENVIIYDWVWNTVSVVMIIGGTVLLVRTQSRLKGTAA